MQPNANPTWDAKYHIKMGLSMLHDSAPLELLACKDKGCQWWAFLTM